MFIYISDRKKSYRSCKLCGLITLKIYLNHIATLISFVLLVITITVHKYLGYNFKFDLALEQETLFTL